MASESNQPSPIPNYAQRVLYLTRKYDFPASHRLFNPDFTEAQNQQVFRECNNANGHGHNYELQVTVKGCPPDNTGMIVDIYALDAIVKQQILDYVDHKHLNMDVPFLRGVIPTAENMVWAFWQQLAPHIPAPAHLAKLRLVETKNNYAEYCGE